MAHTSSAPRTKKQPSQIQSAAWLLPAALGLRFYPGLTAAFIIEREAGAVVAAIAPERPPVAPLTPAAMLVGVGAAGVCDDRRRTETNNCARHNTGAPARFGRRGHRRNDGADHHQRSYPGHHEFFHKSLLLASRSASAFSFATARGSYTGRVRPRARVTIRHSH